MPLVACRLCGLAGAARTCGFSGECKLPPSAAGSAAVAKLQRGLAPRTASAVPVVIARLDDQSGELLDVEAPCGRADQPTAAST
eukprot:2941970-Pyramimonas_sp.AAC.1